MDKKVGNITISEEALKEDLESYSKRDIDQVKSFFDCKKDLIEKENWDETLKAFNSYFIRIYGRSPFKHLFIDILFMSDIDILENIDRIPNHVFVNYEPLRSIHIPDNIKEIGDGAFYTHLDRVPYLEVTGMKNVEKLGEAAFWGQAIVNYDGTQEKLKKVLDNSGVKFDEVFTSGCVVKCSDGKYSLR